MRNIWIVMKKELARVFKDKKLIFTTLIMPGLLLYIIYSFMGLGVGKMVEPEEHYVIYHHNLPEDLQQTVSDIMSADGKTTVEYQFVEKEDITNIEEKIKAKEALLLVEFDEANQTLMYYFSEGNMKSLILFQTFSSIVSHSTSKTVINDIEVSIIVKTVDETETGMSIISGMLPMLIIIFLFQGALAVGPESIAGDKERGTLATLLATPTKRSEIALGKIFSLSILAILASLSSFIGVILSLPKLMQLDGGAMNIGVGTYFYILIILVSTVVVIISIISVISAFAKNVKEAASLSAPVMLISMGIGIFMMFDQGTSNTFVYLIPIYNTALLLKDAFSQSTNVINLIVAASSNLVISALLVYALSKMFNSEKIMFTK